MLLGEVADEDDAGVRHAHHLVAFGMRQAVGAEFHRAAAEIDRLRRAVIDLVRHDELGAVKRRGDARAETTEHAEIGRALASKLVALGGVVDDLRLPLNAWAPKPCSGWKWVSVRINRRRAGQAFR